MRKLLLILLAWLVVMLGLYIFNAVPSHATPASSATCVSMYSYQEKEETVQNVPPHHTFWRIWLTVTYHWDSCTHRFVGRPHWTRDFWVNGCLFCLWKFDRWLKPVITGGHYPDYLFPWFKRVQRAEFSFCPIPLPCEYAYPDAWHKIGWRHESGSHDG